MQAMAGAGVALPMEAVTVFYNPAGIFLQDRIALDMTLGFDDLGLPGSWGISYLKYVQSAKRGAGFGVYRIKDSLPIESDAIAAILATVYQTPIGLPVGVSFKYISENWNDEGREGYFSGDVGALMPYRGFMLGLNFQSITDPESRLLPYRVLFGASRSFGGKITAAFQLGVDDWDDFKNLDHAEYRLGIELRPSSSFALQGGKVETPDLEYWTAGLGLFANGGLASLHAAYHWYPDLDNYDRFYIGYSYYLR